MSSFKSDFKLLGPEHYINSFLVTKNVRPAYLIQNFLQDDKHIKKDIKNILSVFPELQSFSYLENHFLSKNKLNVDDVDTHDKIGKLLRFDCPTKFNDLNRNIPYILYNITTIMKYKKRFILTCYICQNDSKTASAENLVKDINNAIQNDDNLKTIVKDVRLEITPVKPVLPIVNKLQNWDDIITEEDKYLIENVIYNLMQEHNSTKIINNIDYENPVHRGILLCYITEHEHDVMSPLYPLQSSGYMDEIFKIEDKKFELMKEILCYTKNY